ncbi:MAG: hypothetical protein E7590_09115 [Ruminococcaceae bacterium]|nr:hypothetical protein [Oscillospiraceae bacterium]
MRACVEEKVRTFRELNDLALKGEIVVLGSGYMAGFPFYELINRCRLENAVYNRSIEGLTVAEANEILQDAVLELRPTKVFLCFEKIEEPQELKELIERIEAALPSATVYAVSLSTEVGARIKMLCDGKRVCHIGLEIAGGHKAVFKRLCCFFRKKPVDMTDILAMAAL